MPAEESPHFSKFELFKHTQTIRAWPYSHHSNREKVSRNGFQNVRFITHYLRKRSEKIRTYRGYLSALAITRSDGLSINHLAICCCQLSQLWIHVFFCAAKCIDLSETLFKLYNFDYTIDLSIILRGKFVLN